MSSAKSPEHKKKRWFQAKEATFFESANTAELLGESLIEPLLSVTENTTELMPVVKPSRIPDK